MDPLTLGSLGLGALGMVGSFGAGAMSYRGAKEANRANRQLALDQMSFQERMSNTSYQRAMHDMQLAGLNPILAYNQGGASSPMGSSATMTNELSGAVSSAMEAKRLNAELQNLHEQNSNLRSQNDQIQSQTALNRALVKSAMNEADLKGVHAEAAKLGLPGLKTEAAIDENIFGKMTRILQRINPLSNTLNKFLW